MPAPARAPTITDMSYAVVWSEADSAARVGKLELHDGSLVLDGANGLDRIPVSDIVALRIGRSRSERLGGRPVLELQLVRARILRLATLSGIGALHEIADHIAGRLAPR